MNNDPAFRRLIYLVVGGIVVCLAVLAFALSQLLDRPADDAVKTVPGPVAPTVRPTSTRS